MNPTTPDLLSFARLLVDGLEEIGSTYMLGGALAVTAWAEARSTQDVDLVVNLPIERAGQFSKMLEARDVLVPPDIILNHLLEDRTDLPLSAIHLYSSQRADIFLLHKGDRLRESALSRRRRVDFDKPLGSVWVHSPEDLILYKLRYFSIGEQDKHVRDIAAILGALERQIDTGYIETWIHTLGLGEVWVRMQVEVARKLR